MACNWRRVRFLIYLDIGRVDLHAIPADSHFPQFLLSAAASPMCWRIAGYTHIDRAVGLLVVFEHGDQGAADGQRSAVQGVYNNDERRTKHGNLDDSRSSSPIGGPHPSPRDGRGSGDHRKQSAGGEAGTDGSEAVVAMPSGKRQGEGLDGRRFRRPAGRLPGVSELPLLAGVT